MTLLKRKTTWFIAAGLLVLVAAICWVAWVELSKPHRRVDDVIGMRTPEEVVQLLNEGKVSEVIYPKGSENSYRWIVLIVLKDGQAFNTGPVSTILKAIEQCGEPCQDLDIEAWE